MPALRPHASWTVAAALASLLATACGGGSSAPAPAISSFAPSQASLVLGASTTLSWSVSGATSVTIDPGVGAVSGASTVVTPGSTTAYTLTAAGPGGRTTRIATVTVTAPPTLLEVACSGAGCAASSPSFHSGRGVGLWRYRNSTGVAQTIDLLIGGVTGGQQAALIFSNATGDDLSTLPSAGALASPPAATPTPRTLQASRVALPADPVEQARRAWQQALLESNLALGRSLRSPGPARRLAALAPAAALAVAVAPPAVGDHRSWNETMSDPVATFDTVALEICPLPGGRRAVFWVDPASTRSGSLTAEDLAYFTTTFCGAVGAEADGGFARVMALRGAPWGPVGPDLASVVISDSPILQDLNLVFLEIPGTSKLWAGYFSGANTVRRSYSTEYAASNEALAFFIDATQVHVQSESRSYLGSALLHELTHLVNFYQRPIVRDTYFELWLEETTALMTEDLVAPLVTPDHYSATARQRLQPYLASGGAIGLMGWSYPEQDSYSLGGALGGFLNRRYGTSILTGTVDCPGTGVDCLDGAIVAAGGAGFADEFDRLGASIFALLPPDGLPAGYGYPEKVSGDYTLAAIDVSAWAALRSEQAATLGDAFPAGSHTYQLDTIEAGRAIYGRTGVVVPAGSSIMLVIQ